MKVFEALGGKHFKDNTVLIEIEVVEGLGDELCYSRFNFIATKAMVMDFQKGLQKIISEMEDD